MAITGALRQLSAYVESYRRSNPWHWATILAGITVAAGVSVLLANLFVKLDWLARTDLLGVAGVMFGIVVGSATVLSTVNTLKILHHQRSAILSYDQLLAEILQGFEAVRSQVQENREVEPIRIVSPSLAIGNISAHFRNFHDFQAFFGHVDVLQRVQFEIVSQVDFSKWHAGYIARRVGAIGDALEDPSKRRKSRVAGEVLEDEFPEDWFSDLRNDCSNVEYSDATDQLRRARAELGTAIRARSGITDELRHHLKTLELLAHRNADIQAFGIIQKLRSQENVHLLEDFDERMPPFIAISLNGRAYLCWIFPTPGGTKNVIVGTMSSEERDRKIVASLFQYYQNTSYGQNHSLTAQEVIDSIANHYKSLPVADILQQQNLPAP